ncbi:hypothetical protein [Streptomyces sp. NPDC059398]|uniref:hypothetical protein n=1 Tax=Streptomyces sp. NPDC059398 TaxID=3346820 RepID=UPI0036931841
MAQGGCVHGLPHPGHTGNQALLEHSQCNQHSHPFWYARRPELAQLFGSGAQSDDQRLDPCYVCGPVRPPTLSKGIAERDRWAGIAFADSRAVACRVELRV